MHNLFQKFMIWMLMSLNLLIQISKLIEYQDKVIHLIDTFLEILSMQQHLEALNLLIIQYLLVLDVLDKKPINLLINNKVLYLIIVPLTIHQLLIDKE
jgi:hypothetical protein